MVSQNLLFDAGLVLYILVGSTSWGYILLRAGWPNIRSLGIEYKSGWSVIFGLIFTGVVASISLILGFMELTGMNFLEITASVSTIVFFTGIALVTLKRKFIGAKRVNVAVPKRAVAANIAAKKAVEQLPQKTYIKVSKEGAEKIHELKPQPATDALPKVVEPKTRAIAEPKKSTQTNADLQEKETKSVLKGIAAGFFGKKTSIREPEKKQGAFSETKAIKVPLKKPFFGGILEKEKTYGKKQKSADEILDELEKNQSVREKKTTMTREEINSRIEEAEMFIKQNMKEKLGPKPKPKEEPDKTGGTEKIEKALPKSAMLLKKLLQETNENNGGEDAQ